jgi:hypothetical protein
MHIEDVLLHNRLAIRHIKHGQVDFLINPNPKEPRKGGRIKIEDQQLVMSSVENGNFIKLPPNIQEVLARRFLIDFPMGYGKIGDLFKRSREIPRRWENRGLTILRGGQASSRWRYESKR